MKKISKQLNLWITSEMEFAHILRYDLRKEEVPISVIHKFQRSFHTKSVPLKGMD